MSTRDSQWGKVRDAIAEVPQDRLTNAPLQSFVDGVLRSRWYRGRYRLAYPGAAKKSKGLLMPPAVRIQSRASTWQSCEGTSHAMDRALLWTPCTDPRSPSQPTSLGALHVLSHLLVREHPLHCPEWAMNYLKMIQQYATTAEYNAMRASFKQHRVKTFTWSDDAKAAAKVRAAEKQFRTAGERARALVAALEAED